MEIEQLSRTVEQVVRFLDDGMSDEEIQARTPEDIEVNSFEDVVARQLREAALAEDDPKLRERLWEEYRKYTGLK